MLEDFKKHVLKLLDLDEIARLTVTHIIGISYVNDQSLKKLDIGLKPFEDFSGLTRRILLDDRIFSIQGLIHHRSRN
jgi:hypothetical protein